MKKRFMAAFVALVMVLMLVPGQVFASAESVSLDISAGSIVITETGYTHGGGEEVPFTGRYIITQSDPSPTANTVAVKSGAADITFTSKTNIDVSNTSDACAFSVAAGASATITLSNSVVLKSGANCAGLQVPTGAAVTLRATKDYWSLTATGGACGAGIGGGYQKPAGNITVESGKITANGGSGAAGIGGGSHGSGTGTGEIIRISGGAVTTNGGSGGAGIGGSYAGTGESGSSSIEGTADVISTGGTGAAGIGGGSSSGAGTGINGSILITGCAIVSATGKAGGAGIGGGYGAGTGTGGKITISGYAHVTATCTKGSASAGTGLNYEYSGAGIGGGSGNLYSAFAGTGADGMIFITGNATVFATASRGAAIGSGHGTSTNSSNIKSNFPGCTGDQGKLVISQNPYIEATGYVRGIGGGYSTGRYGAINISGGTIIAAATAGPASTYYPTSGLGFGGATEEGGAVNITGGYITATGHYGMSGANLYGGTVTAVATYTKATSGFSVSPTVSAGSYPWVFATPAAPTAVSGIFFSGTEGVQYGDTYLTEQDQEIPAGHTLTVAADQLLVVTEGTTLTVNGRLIVEGELFVEDESGLVLGEGARLEGNVPHDHDLISCAARPATCAEAGCIAHWRCSFCGRYFADAAAIRELDYDEVVLPPMGHDFRNGTCGNCDLVVAEATLLVDTVVGAPGQTVRVPLTLVNNPGIISAKVDISFDTDRLELVEVEDAGLLEDPVFGNALTSPYTLTWENGQRAENITGDGLLATLVFRVKDSAPLGAAAVTAAISQTVTAQLGQVDFGVVDGAVNVAAYVPGDANGDGVASLLDAALMRRFIAGWDVTLDEVAADLNGNGTVDLTDVVILRRSLAGWDGYRLPYTGETTDAARVQYSAIPTDAVFAVSDAVAQPGDTVVLDITLSNNPGIVAALLRLDYDPTQLELVSAQDCQVLSQPVFGNNCAAVPYILSWEDGTASRDITADGMVVTLTFRVLEGCGEAEVSVSVAESFNAELEPVSFRTVSGTVYGDVTAVYDEQPGNVAVENLPLGVTAYAAAYRGGQMVWVGLPEQAGSAPADADELCILFVGENWSPAGACRTFSLKAGQTE